MLYHLLKILFIPTYKAYFKSVHISGKENIPKKGPIILSVNHNSAFMDPILIAVLLRQRVYYFLARGEAFNSKFAVAFYKLINMLPIYRPETMPDQVHKNKFVFQQCYKHLEKGKAIMMFPEGVSETVRRLRPVKTGLARMAFGAEELNNFELNVKIIPVGINYSNPHLFQSDVYINIGEAINAVDYKDKYHTNSKKAISELTEKIKAEMEESIVHIADERLDEFVGNLEYIVDKELNVANGKNQLIERFNFTKDIINKVRLFSEKNPAAFKDYEMRLSNFTQRLKRLRFQGDHYSMKSPITIALRIIAMLIGLIPFCLGFIGNFIPIYLTSLLSKKVEVREDFIGSLKSVGGMFIFLLYNVFMLIVLSIYQSFSIALIFLVALYFIGLFAIYYARFYKNTMNDIRFFRLNRNKSNSLAELAKERNEILKTLDHDFAEA